MTRSAAFSPDYHTARQRFRQAASQCGWTLQSHGIAEPGPDAEQLTMDVACSPGGDPSKVLVLSSGIHGVEGFLGSAVQLEWLRRWSSRPAPPVKCVLLHGLNPYGFAWLRRCDENNVDLNRNFLLPGQRYAGAPQGYAELNALLNPQRPASRCEPWMLKAAAAVVRRGMPALRQAVAAGQYDFPQGLFYGGSAPAAINGFLATHLPHLLSGSRHVVHLDFHSGLGRNGTCKLLIDYPLTDLQRSRLCDWYGAAALETDDCRSIAYETRGGFGAWCVARHREIDYLFAYAEFGTYGPLRVLAGLRAENQAHHWSAPRTASTLEAKRRLKELFCPAATSWRSEVLARSRELVDRAIQGLERLDTAAPQRPPDG